MGGGEGVGRKSVEDEKVVGAYSEGGRAIPLDGVTSRAQLALARVSFRRGFRVLTIVDWRFLPVVSFLLRRQYV